VVNRQANKLHLISMMYKMPDSKREEIKNQILDWLSQEKDWQVVASKEEEEHYYYFSCRVELTKDMSCNVAIEKDVERVNIIANGKFSENDVTSHKLSPSRKNFWIDLKVNLIHMGVNVAVNPNVEQLDSIQLGKPIYFDGWSHDKFIETILKVTDALELVEFTFHLFAEAMSQQRQEKD
jgi:hypothetical protein